jgi:hypothetical protein
MVGDLAQRGDASYEDWVDEVQQTEKRRERTTKALECLRRFRASRDEAEITQAIRLLERNVE